MKYHSFGNMDKKFSRLIQQSSLFTVEYVYPNYIFEYIFFSFDEAGLKYIADNFNEEYDEYFIFMDDKNYIYKMTLSDGQIEKTGKKYKSSIYNKLSINALKNCSKITEYKKQLTENQSESTVIKYTSTLYRPTYKKYFFCDKLDGKGWFFRLKPIKENGSFPVVIYHHGNGLNRATKNELQMSEYRYLVRNINKHKCHQIVMHTDSDCEYNTDAHSRALSQIIEYLCKTYNNVDLNRIYLIGTSHGGYATIYEILRHPDKYAAAIVVMGYTHNEKCKIYFEPQNSYQRYLTDTDYETISDTPIFLAYAEDDSENITASNILLKEKLAEHSSNFKVKEYKSGGHSIFVKFYKSDLWADWLFGQTKNK